MGYCFLEKGHEKKHMSTKNVDMLIKQRAGLPKEPGSYSNPFGLVRVEKHPVAYVWATQLRWIPSTTFETQLDSFPKIEHLRWLGLWSPRVIYISAELQHFDCWRTIRLVLPCSYPVKIDQRKTCRAPWQFFHPTTHASDVPLPIEGFNNPRPHRPGLSFGWGDKARVARNTGIHASGILLMIEGVLLQGNKNLCWGMLGVYRGYGHV